MEHNNNALPVGTLLQGGKYKILKVIGQGGFSITYEGVQTEQNRRVAVKEFFMYDLCERDIDGTVKASIEGIFSEYMKDFLMNSHLLMDLFHPNLILVYDVFQEKNTAYRVMPFVEGDNLSDYVNRKDGLSETEALPIIEDICNVFNYLHETNSLHLDIKPQKFIRRADGLVILTDLGAILKDNDDDTTSTKNPYTLGYSPLELTAGSGKVTPATDVYGLGATLYKLLTNRRIPSASELYMDGHSELEDNLNQCGVSDRTAKVIVKAMEPSVRNRFQSVPEFAGALGIIIEQDHKQRENANSYEKDTEETDYTQVEEVIPQDVLKNALPVGALLHSQNYTYEIKRVLGQGSFGITYLANLEIKGPLGALNSNVQVAVKEFFMRDVNGRCETAVTAGSKGGLYDKYKEKFRKESLHLAELKHPNIVKVLEAFEANNTYYYSMEYVDGMSLDAYIKQQGHLTLREAISIVNETGKALSFMHEQKMLHLDLKPLNIMRRSNGQIVLIDFGLSKQYDEDGKPESSTTIGAGTPGYAPLEQSTYHEGKGFPVTMDVYALAATLYKMLTGLTPQNASDILNDGLNKDSLRMNLLNDNVIDIIERGMSPMKKDRPQSVTEFIDCLNKL